jgi:3-dehydroquinate dehydratase-2
MMRIDIINGPNLNLLGIREPEVYGVKTFEEYFSSLKVLFSEIDLHYFQSNVEGETHQSFA